MDYNYLDQYYL